MTNPQTRFAFGKNWQSFVSTVDDSKIAQAKTAMLRLIREEDLRGRSFIDIGCGSGLHSLVAAQLGADVTATDIDLDCIAATKTLLEREGCTCAVRQADVFELTGSFDIAYSWGVLHHTGDMWAAIGKAASLVKPGGRFVFSLYQATQFDALWKFEKRTYIAAPAPVQAIARAAYRLAFRAACQRLADCSYREFVRDYYKGRGMDHAHDVHDWLGGYPYETASPAEVERKLAALGFAQEKAFIFPLRLRGLFGSACDEYVYVKV